MMNTDNNFRVLTIDAASRRFPGLSSSAIRRLVRSGEIPSRKVGVKYLLMPESIELWLKGSTTQAEKTDKASGIRRVEG